MNIPKASRLLGGSISQSGSLDEGAYKDYYDEISRISRYFVGYSVPEVHGPVKVDMIIRMPPSWQGNHKGL